MALRQSKMVLCVAVYILEMLLFADNVKSAILVANAGENITLSCSTYARYMWNTQWVKGNQYPIAAVSASNPHGFLYNGSLFTQSYEMEISPRLFNLYIYDARAESATYDCRYGSKHIQEYDVRVIGCPACFVNLSSSHDSEQPRKDVNCLLNNFHTAERIRLHITMNRNITNTAIIEGSILTFSISNTMMYDTIQVEFNPFTDALTNITCIVSAQLTTPQSYTSVKLSPSTSLMTTSATSSPKASAKSLATKSETRSETTSAAITTVHLTTPQSHTSVKLSPSRPTSLMTTSPTSPSTTSAKTSATKSETTSETTSASITTTGAKPHDSMQKSSSSPIMETSYLNSGTTTSPSTPSITKSETSSSTTSATTTSNHTRKKINPGTENNTKNNGITIIIIAILGAILMIVVIVIIFVLRLKRSRDRQHGKRNESEINVAVREQDTCYESIGGSSGIRDGELINNVLYESSDEIIQSSILRSGDDQLQTDLYTVPDKTGIIKRVAKSEVASVSSNGNSSMNRHQHEQKEFKEVGAGDDDDTNIPLYAMPDKGPRSTKNGRKTSPGSASTEGGVDIPLYALPDKRPGSKGDIMKTTPGPGTRNEGDEIPLYAVLNKEPGSKDNLLTEKPKPGNQSKASNKNDTHHEEALYAEVDKSN